MNVASHALNNFPGNIEILDKLFSGYEKLKIGFAATNSLNTALLYFAFNTGQAISNAAGIFGHTELVKLLLADSRVDPSVEDNEAIQCASENGYTEVVKLLVADARVNPADNNNYAIREAAQNNHINVVRLLLADPRMDLQTRDEVMWDAINAGNPQIAAEIAFNRFGVFSHVAREKIDSEEISPEIPKVII